jgi:hypothetical protein
MVAREFVPRGRQLTGQSQHSAYDTNSPKNQWTRLPSADIVEAWKEASFSKRVRPRGDSYQPRESKGGDPTWQQEGRMRVGSARCGLTKLSNGFSNPSR